MITHAVSETGRVAEALQQSEERYRTFLALSGDAIARLEMDVPLAVHAPLDEQVQFLQRHAYVRECNEAFARLYGYARAADVIGLAICEHRREGAAEAVRTFIQHRYQLVDREFPLGDRLAPPKRWVRASAAGVIENGRLMRVWVTLRDVTHRKRMEDALLALAEGVSSQTGELFFRSLVQALGEAIGADQAFVGVLDEGGDWIRTIAACNRTGHTENFRYALDGAPCEKVLASGLCYYPSDVQQAFPRDAFLAEQGIEGYAGCPLLDTRGRPTGLLVALFERPIPQPEIAASILRLFGVRASTELMRSRAVEAAQASEKKYRDIVDLSPLGIYQSTPDGRVLMANESLARILGYDSAQELLSLDVARDVYFDPQERERATEEHDPEGRALDIELRLRKRDGSPVWVQNNAHAIKDASGGTLYFEGFIHDINARKRDEDEQRLLTEAIMEAAAEWQRTFDAVDSCLFLFDRAGRVVRLNRAAAESLGRDPAEIIGRLKDDLGPEEPWRTARDVVAAAETTGGLTSAQARDVGGRRTWDLSATRAVASGASNERIILAVRDITGVVELQETLRRNEAMVAMGSLVAGVAHEVRNPLFSISATVDALHTELGEQVRYAEYWPLLRTQVGRLTQLMQDLLDYAKPQALRPVPTSVKDVIARGIRACSVLARQSGVRVVDEAGWDLPPVELDMARAEQVFENLTANAIQHSPRGATVRLSTTLVREGRSSAIQCSVEDQGPGISEKDLPRVFEPFFSRRRGGTGLGLSVVQRIVAGHGGQVVAANRPAGGAIFTVCLPVTLLEEPGQDADLADSPGVDLWDRRLVPAGQA